MSASGEPFSGEVIVYETSDGEARVDVRLERETVWLTQKQMAELFDTSTDNVGLHLKNIFDEGELVEAATTEDYSVVQIEGRRKVRRRVRHYNLDAIISVGYRPPSVATVAPALAPRRVRHGRTPAYPRRAAPRSPAPRRARYRGQRRSGRRVPRAG